jgi:hypothetical protein
MKNKVIFIHGFGVSKGARGIFTDIEKYIPQNEYIYTDLNIVENNDGKENITINTVNEQVEIIKKVVGKEIETNINTNYIFICHSMGCVIFSILYEKFLVGFFASQKIPLTSIKVILLAPPVNNDLEKTFDRYRQKPENILDLNGLSKLFRRDGSITFIPKEFWESRKNINFLETYKKIKTLNPKIIIARQDEVIENSEENLNTLKYVGEVISIDGNHNFDKERENLAKTIINLNLF